MSAPLNPYHKWLGIPPEELPAHHYRLLGLKPFESDRDVIEHACDPRMVHLKTFATSPHADLAQKLLDEVVAARSCLLDIQQKAASRPSLPGTLRLSGPRLLRPRARFLAIT